MSHVMNHELERLKHFQNMNNDWQLLFAAELSLLTGPLNDFELQAREDGVKLTPWLFVISWTPVKYVARF